MVRCRSPEPRWEVAYGPSERSGAAPVSRGSAAWRGQHLRTSWRQFALPLAARGLRHVPVVLQNSASDFRISPSARRCVVFSPGRGCPAAPESALRRLRTRMSLGLDVHLGVSSPASRPRQSRTPAHRLVHAPILCLGHAGRLRC
eukprot:scaffold1590_cov239-Pinguiococcus_pyrenoidosus.AAC.14